jgi:hypothetical protein
MILANSSSLLSCGSKNIHNHAFSHEIDKTRFHGAIDELIYLKKEIARAEPNRVAEADYLHQLWELYQRLCT